MNRLASLLAALALPVAALAATQDIYPGSAPGNGRPMFTAEFAPRGVEETVPFLFVPGVNQPNTYCDHGKLTSNATQGYYVVARCYNTRLKKSADGRYQGFIVTSNGRTGADCGKNWEYGFTVAGMAGPGGAANLICIGGNSANKNRKIIQRIPDGQLIGPSRAYNFWPGTPPLLWPAQKGIAAPAPAAPAPAQEEAPAAPAVEAADAPAPEEAPAAEPAPQG